MTPTYCPRCGKPLLPAARQCPFCGLETFVPGLPGSPPGARVPPPGWPLPESREQGRPGWGALPQAGWGAPQPDQSSSKTIVIAGCLILILLLFIIVPAAIFLFAVPRLEGALRGMPSFPPDLPFPSFFP